MYDYREEVKNDIIERIREDYEKKDYVERIKDDRENFAEELNEKFWIDDAVTGNASGSYTFNTYKAEENLCHNMELLNECASEFGGNVGEWLERGAEFCDVSIRCYLLAGCIESAFDEIEDDDPDEEEPHGIFKLETHSGRIKYFDTCAELLDFLFEQYHDDEPNNHGGGFGDMFTYKLYAKMLAIYGEDFTLICERKTGDDFTRVYDAFESLYVIDGFEDKAKDFAYLCRIFGELAC